MARLSAQTNSGNKVMGSSLTASLQTKQGLMGRSRRRLSDILIAVQTSHLTPRFFCIFYTSILFHIWIDIICKWTVLECTVVRNSFNAAWWCTIRIMTLIISVLVIVTVPGMPNNHTRSSRQHSRQDEQTVYFSQFQCWNLRVGSDVCCKQTSDELKLCSLSVSIICLNPCKNLCEGVHVNMPKNLLHWPRKACSSSHSWHKKLHGAVVIHEHAVWNTPYDINPDRVLLQYSALLLGWFVFFSVQNKCTYIEHFVCVSILWRPYRDMVVSWL